MEKNVEITRYENGTFSTQEDIVLVESEFSIFINNELTVKLLVVPEKLEELIIGYLYSEGFIESIHDIDKIDIDEDAGYVNLSGIKEGSTLVTTDSGDYKAIPYSFNSIHREKLAANQWNPEDILENANILLEGSSLFKKTGNVHSVMICIGKEVISFSEDIGRYNAFDKSVGEAIMKNIDLTKATIYTSGRIPSTVAMKAIRVGIPFIVSRSAPTYKTLEIADRFNLSVVGFAKGSRMNIYKDFYNKKKGKNTDKG